jgi:hypothetical protein
MVVSTPLGAESSELPGRNFEATEPTQASLQVETANFKLKVAGNDKPEDYDLPSRCF